MLAFFCGQRWIRTTEDVSQQIYSLPHLATLEFALLFPNYACKPFKNHAATSVDTKRLQS